MSGISEQIRDLRTKHSLSQEQLANLLGVSFTTVNAWEAGKRVPQHSMTALLQKIAQTGTLQNANHVDVSVKKAGLSRSDAGFVSSVISYNAKKDDYSYTHGIGRWYGCLPSFLVRDLVKFIGTDLGEVSRALVNFSGSGTVALEFALAGINCEAIDINPVALLLSKVKTKKITALTHESIQELLQKIKSFDPKEVQKFSDDLASRQFAEKNLVATENQWITKEAQELFKKIIFCINSLAENSQQVLLATALLNVSIDNCQIDKRCTNHYVFKENNFSESKFWQTFEQEIFYINDKLKLLHELPNFAVPNISAQDNTSTDFDDNSFDIVFSHPPYGTTINYYSMSRVQISILELLTSSEFSSADLNKNLLQQTKRSDHSSGTLEKFYSGVSNWVREAHRVLKKDGHMIVIVGDSRNNGFLSHPHTEIINKAAELGLILKELFIWITENKSGMHIRRKGHHIDHNYILVFKKVR